MKTSITIPDDLWTEVEIAFSAGIPSEVFSDQMPSPSEMVQIALRQYIETNPHVIRHRIESLRHQAIMTEVQIEVLEKKLATISPIRNSRTRPSRSSNTGEGSPTGVEGTPRSNVPQAPVQDPKEGGEP